MAQANVACGTAPVSKETAADRRAKLEPLYRANLLTWEVALAAYSGWQFKFAGGFSSEPVAFDYSDLRSVFWLMNVPKHRRRETFEKFKVLEPYLLEALRQALKKATSGSKSKHNADDPPRRRR